MGADIFDGGSGTHTATDYNAREGIPGRTYRSRLGNQRSRAGALTVAAALASERSGRPPSRSRASCWIGISFFSLGPHLCPRNSPSSGHFRRGLSPSQKCVTLQ